MKRIQWIALAPFALTAFVRAADTRPNILALLSDDQGYADASFQGSKDVPTPHLDSLAKEGLRCPSGYVTHPYCSPSRDAHSATARSQNSKFHLRHGVKMSRSALPLRGHHNPELTCHARRLFVQITL
jgi:hypothetical protein